MLGKTVYYINFKEKTVESGRIKQVHPTSSGYEAYLILHEDKVLQVESSICYDTEETAREHLDHLVSVNEEMNAISAEAKNKIDALRISILGEPTCKDLL